MGQILSNPVIDKEHHSGADAFTAFGVCAMQGWRMSMEDAHIVQLNLLPNEKEDDDNEDHLALYSVFDGHGGSNVAEFCGDKTASILTKLNSFQELKGGTRNLGQVLIDCYLKLDEELLKDPVLQNDHSGCTATSVLISKKQGKIVCGNSGDSRTVLSTGSRAKTLSFDHKPTLPSERSRIVAAKGFVEMDRVNGNLALSRAIGDFEFKSNDELSPYEQIVTCVPDIVTHDIDYDQDEFVILACDGIWDCLSSQECVDLIHYGIAKGDMSLNDISSHIIDVCCSPTTEGTGIGCDNMSIIIVALLKDNETVDEWFTRIRNKDHGSKTSFAERRRQIYHYYPFSRSDSDDQVFAITRKSPNERFTSTSPSKDDSNMDVDDTDEDSDSNNPNGSRRPLGGGPVDLFSLEALLGASGIKISGGGDGSIQESALSEMLASLTNAANASASLNKSNDSSDSTTNDKDDSRSNDDKKIEEIVDDKH